MEKFKLNLPMSIFTNTFYQGFGKVVVVFLGLITTIMLTRYLGVLAFGQLNLIFAYLGIASTFADFGLTTILAREEARSRADDNFINAVFTLRIILTITTLIIFIILSFFFYSGQIILGIAIYSFASFFLLFYNMIFSLFQARLIMEKHMVSQISGSFLTLLVTVLFIYLKLPFLWIVGAQVVGNVTIAIVGWRLLNRKIGLNVDVLIFKKIMKSAGPIFVSSIIAVLYWRLDIIILSFFKDPNVLPDVGIYSTAYRVFEVFIIFGTFFTNSLFPIFVQKINSKNFVRIFTESIVLSLIMGLVSVMMALFLAKYIIFIVGGNDYLGAVFPLQILSLTFMISLFINIFYNLIIAQNMQKHAILIGVVALIFNVVANILFIPKYSYIASSVITVVTSLIILFGYIFITKKTKII